MRTNGTIPTLIGRRSGVLVARDLNDRGCDGMENLEGFFAAALNRKETRTRSQIVEASDAVPRSLFAFVQTWWHDSPPSAVDLSSVSTAPADENESYYGNITDSIESEIEATSYQDHDEDQSSPRPTTSHGGSNNELSLLGGDEATQDFQNTKNDPMVGMIVTDGRENQEGSFQGSEGELDESLISNLMDPEEPVDQILLSDEGKAIQGRHSNAEDLSSMTESMSSIKAGEQTPDDDSQEGVASCVIASTTKGTLPTQESQADLAEILDDTTTSKSLSADLRQRKQERARMIESARFETHSSGSTGNESDGEPLIYDDESPVCPPAPSTSRNKPRVQRKRPSTTSEPPPQKKKKTRGNKKKKPNPYATVFAPEGIPQPISYNIVPVSDLKAGPPEDSRLRRSQRAKVAPLKHWCGERLVYGPNDFGSDYDGVRNMSMVTGIAFANPTQFKKRASGRMNGTKVGTWQRISDEEGEFDLTRLRTKFHVSDGCTAKLWQYEDVVETRKTAILVVFPATMESHTLSFAL